MSATISSKAVRKAFAPSSHTTLMEMSDMGTRTDKYDVDHGSRRVFKVPLKRGSLFTPSTYVAPSIVVQVDPTVFHPTKKTVSTHKKFLQTVFVFVLFIVVLLAWGFMDFVLNLSVWLAINGGWEKISKQDALSALCWGMVGSAIVTSFYAVFSGAAVLPRNTILPFLGGVCNCLGYLSYYSLSEDLPASSVAPVISLYILLPIIVGLTCRGEPITARKMAGITLALSVSYTCPLKNTVLYFLVSTFFHASVQAIIMIGANSSEDQLNENPVTPTDAYFWFSLALTAFGLAAICSSIAGAWCSRADLPIMIISSASGYALCGFIQVILYFHADPFVFFKGNFRENALISSSGVLLLIGLVAFMKLSAISNEMSVVVPLTAMYTMVPTILGFLILGESITWLKTGGIVASVFAVRLLAKTHNQSSSDENATLIDEQKWVSKDVSDQPILDDVLEHTDFTSTGDDFEAFISNHSKGSHENGNGDDSSNSTTLRSNVSFSDQTCDSKRLLSTETETKHEEPSHENADTEAAAFIYA
jgi:drug/metabolite transporter (DMT)-like permease